jgi:predicted nucleic acid-binding protein
MKRYILSLTFCLLVFLTACSSQLSEDEAIEKAKDFVDTNVKFYSNESNETLQKASITIVDTRLMENNWVISMEVRADIDGKEKKKGLAVALDAQTGEIKNMQDFQIE